MLYLQQGPAETTIYMIAGYAVIFGMMLAYLISLVVRWRNLARDEQLFKELDIELD